MCVAPLAVCFYRPLDAGWCSVTVLRSRGLGGFTHGVQHHYTSELVLPPSHPAHRSKEYIGLNLSVVVWKALVGQELQLSDLENVDVLLTRSMQDIRTIDQKGEDTAAVTHTSRQLYVFRCFSFTAAVSCSLVMIGVWCSVGPGEFIALASRLGMGKSLLYPSLQPNSFRERKKNTRSKYRCLYRSGDSQPWRFPADMSTIPRGMQDHLQG